MTVDTSFPVFLSSLLLPSASQSLSSTLSSLKRSTLCTTNRLHSIHHDSLFVQDVASQHNLPLIANERCGSWYIPPTQKAGSAYFKSTDGHWGQWSFSTRRLNLQILNIIGRYGGCIIVDSTRRGKSMPDALSKTIPIWCTVINRLLFGEMHESHELSTPKEVVSASEHTHIATLLDDFVNNVKNLSLDVSSLRSVLQKPLRPFWLTPDSASTQAITPSPDHHTVICCTASRRVYGSEMTEEGYIQGAGDDSEGWSNGLTPALFWRHSAQLLSPVEEDMPNLIHKLMSMDQNHCISPSSDAVKLGPTNLYIGTSFRAAQTEQYDGTIICCGSIPSPQSDQEITRHEEKRMLHLQCGDGKLGSRALRSQLPRISPFIATLPDSSNNTPPRILFVCSTGKDLSVGVALAVLCLFYDDDYRYSWHAASRPFIDKALIRRRLATITTAKPDANPSRSTLQSVHSFLMPRGD